MRQLGLIFVLGKRGKRRALLGESNAAGDTFQRSRLCRTPGSRRIRPIFAREEEEQQRENRRGRVARSNR